MNILREIRRLKKRNIAVRILILLVFLTFLIINTYAWYSMARKINIGSLGATVNELNWNAEFYKNSDKLQETVVFNVNKIYPGINFEDHIVVKNADTRAASLTFSLKKIILFGDIIYLSDRQVDHLNQIEGQKFGDIVYSKNKYLQLEIKDDNNRVVKTIDLLGYSNSTVGEPQIQTTEVTETGDPTDPNDENYTPTGINRVDATIIDTSETYCVVEGQTKKFPFTVTYGYNKDYIKDIYISNEATPGAIANFYVKLDWAYQLIETIGNQSVVNTNKDALDTWYGEKAYQFYNMTATEAEQKASAFYNNLFVQNESRFAALEGVSSTQLERAKNEKITQLKNEIMEMIQNETAMKIEIELFASS